MEIKTFGVIGAGQMGGGIAQVAAMSGLDVVMNDIKTEFVEKGLATITKLLDRGVEKGKLSEEDKNTILGRIKTSVELKDMASVDYVVEAATENEEIKYQLLKISMESAVIMLSWPPIPRRFQSAASPRKPSGRKK